MKTFCSTQDAHSLLSSGSAIAIGNYDGVHFGHQCILKELVIKAQRHNLKPALLTFAPHPSQVLAPEVAPRMIQSHAQKVESLEKFNLSCTVFQKFDLDFAAKSPEEFFKIFIKDHLNAKLILVGYDFTFGQKRSGTVETLEELGKQHDIEVHVVNAQMLENTLVSSSAIRRLIKDGSIVPANKMLTRPFAIDGKVVHGHKRGQKMGISTANLKSPNELLPHDGVYATLVNYQGQTYKSVSNIGFNPTFENKERSIETHIFDFDLDIYDQEIRLAFIDRIRDEKRFESPADLAVQIQKDIASAHTILKDI